MLLAIGKKNKSIEDNYRFAEEISKKNIKETEMLEINLVGSSSIYVNTGNCQNQGARSYQEDSFGYSNIIDSSFVTQKGFIAILSDGMGGLSNGKEAADSVVQSAIAMFENVNPRQEIHTQLENMLIRINDYVCEQYNTGGSIAAGATIVLIYIYKNRIYWAAAGDSRIYCLRNGNMLQLNEDHDYKNKLFREYLDGNFNFSDIAADSQKDSLVCFMGKNDLPYIDCSIRGYRIKPDDIFVLCSDGIYNAINEEAMKNILSQNDAQSASEKIVNEVVNLHLPGQDNMTVMVVKCSKDGR